MPHAEQTDATCNSSASQRSPGEGGRSLQPQGDFCDFAAKIEVLTLFCF